MTRSQRLTKRSGALPYLMLVAAAVGLALTTMMRRFDLTVFSLVLVVPLVLASIVLLTNKSRTTWDAGLPSYDGGIRFQHLFLVNVIIFAISLVVLTREPTRTFDYFVLVALYSGVLLAQVLRARPRWTDVLILFQIILLSLNLIWGLTLKYPLYFGDTDLLVHMNMINTIVRTGHTPTYYLAYEQYQLYHIYSALGVEITGASVRTGLFILMGLAWQVGIVFAFLIFRDLSKSTRFALVACLLFALSAQVIYYGSYSLPRSLAFVLLMAWLYLVIVKARKDSRYVVVSIAVLAAVILTHHLTTLYTIAVLLVVCFSQLFVRRFRQERTLDVAFMYLISIGGVSYFIWAAQSAMSGSIREAFRALISTEEGIKSLSSLTAGLGVNVIVGTLYYSFALFLCLLGVQAVLKRLQLDDGRQTDGTFGIAGFALLAVYVPGLLYLLPVSDIFMTDRFSLMASPFVAFLMAYGLVYLFRRIFPVTGFMKRVSYYSIPLGLIATTTFLSTISVGNAKDTDYFVHTKNVDSPYFTQSEMDSFSFLTGRADTSLAFYTDYATSRNDYSFGIPAEQPWVYVAPSSPRESEQTMVTRRSIARGISEVSNGYLLLRTGELSRKQSLAFLPQTGYTTIRYPEAELEPQIKALAMSPSAAKVYSDRDVQVYLVR